MSDSINKVNVYIGSDGSLHFTNARGADSVLNFSTKSTIQVIQIFGGKGTYTITSDDVKKYKSFLCISATGALNLVNKNTFSVQDATSELLIDTYASDSNTSPSTHCSLLVYKVSEFKEGSKITSNFNATWRYRGAIIGIS